MIFRKGPVNSGLLHYIFMALCVIAMFAYALYSVVRPAPSKKQVCTIKAYCAALGLLSLLFSFLSFYGHVGIFQTWGGNAFNKFMQGEKKSVCDWCFWTSPPFAANLQNAYAALSGVGAAASSGVKADPEYGNYTEGIEIFVKHMDNIKGVQLDNLDPHFVVIKEFLQPLCEKNFTVPIGKFDFITVMNKVATEYVLNALMVSVWTMVLSFHMMRIYCKRSRLWLLVVCFFSALTSVGWWVMAGILHMLLVFLSDINIRRVDVVHSVLVGLSENISREIVAALLDCASTDGFVIELLSDLKAVAPPIVTLYENIDAALEQGFTKFPPDSQIDDYYLPLKGMLNLIGSLYPACKNIDEMRKGNCARYQGIFSMYIGKPLCTYMYWAAYISYISSMFLAIGLMAFMILALTIKERSTDVCIKRSRVNLEDESEPRPCLETCPRRTDPPVEEPIRQICPKTCMGNIKFKPEPEPPKGFQRFTKFFSRKRNVGKSVARARKVQLQQLEKQGTGDNREPLPETERPEAEKPRATFLSRRRRLGSKPSAKPKTSARMMQRQLGAGDKREPLQETAGEPPAETKPSKRATVKGRKSIQPSAAAQNQKTIPQQGAEDKKEDAEKTQPETKLSKRMTGKGRKSIHPSAAAQIKKSIRLQGAEDKKEPAEKPQPETKLSKRMTDKGRKSIHPSAAAQIRKTFQQKGKEDKTEAEEKPQAETKTSKRMPDKGRKSIHPSAAAQMQKTIPQQGTECKKASLKKPVQEEESVCDPGCPNARKGKEEPIKREQNVTRKKTSQPSPKSQQAITPLVGNSKSESDKKPERKPKPRIYRPVGRRFFSMVQRKRAERKQRKEEEEQRGIPVHGHDLIIM